MHAPEHFHFSYQRLVEFADNVHPASRFAYRIELRR